MASKLSCKKRMKSKGFENRDEMSEKETVPDVFNVFLPCLWTLRLAGMWLPGDLRTATCVRDSLRGSSRAILYMLYCVVVFVSTWHQALRFLPYAAKQTGGELTMVLVVFFGYLYPAFQLTMIRFMRKPLFSFSTALKDYTKRYGQMSYINVMIKTGKRAHCFELVIGFVFTLTLYLYLYVFSTAFYWVTTPIDKEAPWYILVPWKIYIAFDFLVMNFANTSNSGIVRCIATILRNEFSEFNRVMKNKTNPIHAVDSDGETTDRCIALAAMEKSTVEATQASAERCCMEGNAWGEHDSEEAKVSAEEMDDLRCRFERLVDLVEKGNAVVKVQYFSMYMVCVPLLCFNIKGVIDAGNNLEYAILLGLTIFFHIVHVLFSSMEAIRLNIEAHASCQYLQKVSTKNLSEKTLQIINLFVNRLNGSPIGFNILGSITVDVSFVTGLIGTLIAYIFVVVQFDSQSSCSVTSSPDVISTASPVNVTMVTG